jgi:hypothetical protein
VDKLFGTHRIAVGVLGAGTVGTANQSLDLKSLGIVFGRQNGGALADLARQLAVI